MATRSVDTHGIEIAGPLELVQVSTGAVRDVYLGSFGSEIVWRSNAGIELLSTSSRSEIMDTRLVDVRLAGTVDRRASIGRIGAAGWAPGGGALAIVPCGKTHTSSVELLSPAGRRLRQLAQLAGALPEGACLDPAASTLLVWAPDGHSLYVALSSGLWRVSLTGEPARRIQDSEASEPVLSPDGRQLIVAQSKTRGGNTGKLLFVLPATGGPARLLTTEFASEAAWSPDGRRIAFVPTAAEVVKTIPSEGGVATVLTKFPATETEVCCLSWSPTGHKLAFNASSKPPET
jgi:dipeptidyl aminopeptidase/acylaminoacyl peptidase